MGDIEVIQNHPKARGCFVYLFVLALLRPILVPSIPTPNSPFPICGLESACHVFDIFPYIVADDGRTVVTEFHCS